MDAPRLVSAVVADLIEELIRIRDASDSIESFPPGEDFHRAIALVAEGKGDPSFLGELALELVARGWNPFRIPPGTDEELHAQGRLRRRDHAEGNILNVANHIRPGTAVEIA